MMMSNDETMCKIHRSNINKRFYFVVLRLELRTANPINKSFNIKGSEGIIQGQAGYLKF